MLENRLYTRIELTELFKTDRLDSIKAKLKRQGYEFTTSGRGETACVTITKQPLRFRRFCIDVLGFAPQTDFKRLKKFLYKLMFDEEFRQLPFVGMKEYMIQTFYITNQTLCRWVQTLYDNNLITFCEQIYFSINKNRLDMYRPIEEKEYKKAWKLYWDNRENGYHEAFVKMCQSVEGYPFKKEILIFNDLESDKIDTLAEILKEEIDNDEEI